MAVSNLKAPDEWTRETFGGYPAHCFLCGEVVSDVAVTWHGHDWTAASPVDVVLHPACGSTLAIELAGDARNAQRILDGKPLTAGVNPSLIPQGEA